MKRVLSSSSQQPGSNNSKEDEHERLQKKPKRDYTERINRVAAALNKCIEEHDSNKKETFNEIDQTFEEVLGVITEGVKSLKERFNRVFEQSCTEEESRLQESLHKLRTFDENENITDDEEKNKILMEIESALCCIQRYELSHPTLKDVKKWANDTLLSEFKFDVSQSLSNEIKERIPCITEVGESGPNEVHIDLEFLNEYEEAAVKRMKQMKGVTYIVEIWNGEKDKDYEVRSEQVLGTSHKAYIEWRHIGGSECKVRVKAVWTGLFGEEYESVWSKWKSFTVPKEHKNNGIFQAGVAWKKLLGRETYVICDKRTNIILYRGTKPYVILSDFVSGGEILICGQGGDTKWEKEMKIEEIPQTLGNLLEDLKLFHTDKDHCTRVVKEITSIIRSFEETKEYFVNLNGLNVFSNIMRNYIGDATLCTYGIYVFAELFSYEVIRRLAIELGYIELIRDAIRQHIDDVYVCNNGLAAIRNIVYRNTNNRNIARELGCIELIKDVIRLHIDNTVVCRYGLIALDKTISHDTHNKNLAGELGCIELIRDVIRQHIDDTDTCESGFVVINDVILENLPNQLKACEMGWIDFIFEVIEHHKDEQRMAEWYCRCFVRLFSSQETHDKWCTEDVINKVEECQEKYKDSQLINKCLICLKRIEDPRVADAVSRGVCTKETTACKNEDCQREKNDCLCLECTTPQKCYQCFDCEGCKACCETCWKTKHAGHKGREFFDLITYCE